MSQHDFDELLQKYLAGACDPAEETLILAWYQDMTTQHSEPVDAREKEAIRQRVWQKIAASTTEKAALRRSAGLFRWAGAACLALLILAGIWRYGVTPAPAPVAHEGPTPGSIQLSNSSPAAQKIKLEDGSVVTLKPGATLSYPHHFGRKSRTVYLKGEAFFSVRKNPAKPFIVHTGELITEVLGTSFTIKSYPNEKAIEVAVTTGRVSVYQAADGAHRRSNEVILKPNERITYSSHSKQLIPTLVAHPVQVTAHQPVSLHFDGTPLPDVLTRLQVVYGIDIVLESDGLTACVLNADLTDLPLHDQLDLICRSVNATNEVRGTSIFIKGTGCQ